MTTEEKYIERCINIAKHGLGTTAPNPMVGAVIVYEDRIIGEGYTSPYGGPHAEVNAINSVQDQSLLSNSTLYVTLEPCSHFGKTPPCSDLIIRHGIPKVVIGCVDDNPQVSGSGITKLKDSRCQVTVGVLESKCKSHHKRFFTYHNKKRPYIILKWAQTADGYIAPDSKAEQKPVWITNSYSRQLVHKWRSEEQAILVGANTVREDNPTLTARDWSGSHPIRIVIDKDQSLDPKMNVFNNDVQTKVLSSGVLDFKRPLAIQICDFLFQESINSVIIEGGRQTIQTFIDEGLWDEARVFTGTKVHFGSGVKAPEIHGIEFRKEHIDSDLIQYYKPLH